MQSVAIELPEEILRLLGSPESAPAAARQVIVLELLREAKISQGKAAELLDLSRWDTMNLVVQREIPSDPQTAEEMREEIETIRSVTSTR